MKVWRRLQALGAVAVKNAVYALPASEQAQEDFEWLLREIADGGGEAFVCEARLVDGLSDQEVGPCSIGRATPTTRRSPRRRATSPARSATAAVAEQRAEGGAQLARLKARLAQVVAIDFFGANGRETADGCCRARDRLREDEPCPNRRIRSAARLDLKGRDLGDPPRRPRRPHRVGLADPPLHRSGGELQVRAGEGYVPEPGELRFDMFEAEFTHEGDRCTFEVLLARAGLTDPALRAIAEIVHDIDLKDGKFGRAEAEGIRTLIAGLCAATGDDAERLPAAAAIFEDLYAILPQEDGR